MIKSPLRYHGGKSRAIQKMKLLLPKEFIKRFGSKTPPFRAAFLDFECRLLEPLRELLQH
jgi:hypothetical protein